MRRSTECSMIKRLLRLSYVVILLTTTFGINQEVSANTMQQNQILTLPGEHIESSQRVSSLETIHVRLEIKFQGHELGIINELIIPQGFTVNQAISSVYKVTNGVVCCRNTDIRCINDVCFNPSHNIFWTIGINGNYQNSSANSVLMEGDDVVLTLEGDIKHESLEVFLDRMQRG